MIGRWGLVLAWVVLLTCDTASQTAFKIGSAALNGADGVAWVVILITSPWILAGIFGYFCSFLSWMLILRRLDLSLAFPMTALGYISVLIASQVLLGETVDGVRWLGVACIVGGFMLMLGETDEIPLPESTPDSGSPGTKTGTARSGSRGVSALSPPR